MRLSRGLALIVWLGSSAVISSTTSGAGFSLPGVAYAGSCTPLAQSSSDQTASNGLGTFGDIEKSFTAARAAEGCSTPLNLTANQCITEAAWIG